MMRIVYFYACVRVCCFFFVVVSIHFVVIRWKQCLHVHEKCFALLSCCELLDLFYFISKIGFFSPKTCDNSNNIEALVLSIGHQCERHESKWNARRNKNNTTNESIHLLIHLFQFAHINSSKFTTNGTLNYCRQLAGVYVFYFFFVDVAAAAAAEVDLNFIYYLHFSSSNFLLISAQCDAMSCRVMLFPLTINI